MQKNDMQLSLNYNVETSENSDKPTDNDKKRIQFLKDEINKSNYKYYVEENPYLSDFEYDKMFAVSLPT